MTGFGKWNIIKKMATAPEAAVSFLFFVFFFWGGVQLWSTKDQTKFTHSKMALNSDSMIMKWLTK